MLKALKKRIPFKLYQAFLIKELKPTKTSLYAQQNNST